MLSKFTKFWDEKKESILESKFTCITLRLRKIRARYVYYHFQHRNNRIYLFNTLCKLYLVLWGIPSSGLLRFPKLVLQRTNLTWWTYWAPHREVIILMCPDKHNHFWLLPFLNMFNITTFPLAFSLLYSFLVLYFYKTFLNIFDSWFLILFFGMSNQCKSLFSHKYSWLCHAHNYDIKLLRTQPTCKHGHTSKVSFTNFSRLLYNLCVSSKQSRNIKVLYHYVSYVL